MTHIDSLKTQIKFLNTFVMVVKDMKKYGEQNLSLIHIFKIQF